MCLSHDNSLIGLVGRVESTIAQIGNAKAAYFAVVENSQDMEELSVFRIWDPSNIVLELEYERCAMMNGST